MFAFIWYFLFVIGVTASTHCDRTGIPNSDYCYRMPNEDNRVKAAYGYAFSRGYFEICNGCNRTVCAQIGLVVMNDRYHPVENVCVTDEPESAVFFGTSGMSSRYPITFRITSDKLEFSSRKEQLTAVVDLPVRLGNITGSSYLVIDFNENCLDLDFQDMKLPLQDCTLAKSIDEAAYAKMRSLMQISAGSVLPLIVFIVAFALFFIRRAEIDEVGLKDGTKKTDILPLMDAYKGKEHLEQEMLRSNGVPSGD